MSDVMFTARLEHILRESVAGLPERDRAERVAECQRTGQHGVRLLVDGDELRFVWGGRLLAVVPVAMLEDEAMYQPVAPAFLPEAAADVSTLDGER